MKKRFLIMVDYGTGGTAYFVDAYSREQIDEIFDTTNSAWISVIEENFEDEPLYQALTIQNPNLLTYDVDKPEGALKFYMDKNSGSAPK